MNAHKTWLRTIAICLSVCFVIVGLWAWGMHKIYNFKHKYDNLTLIQLEKKIDIVFPPSTKLLRHSAMVGLSGETRARLCMSKQDAIPFITYLKERVHKEENVQISTRDDLGINTLGYSHPEWWQPGSPRRFVAVRFPGDVQVLFIDLDNSNLATVYVLWAY